MSTNADPLATFTLVIIAGLFVHACLQLGVSLLTLLGSHAIGTGKSHGTILRLSFSYILGALVITYGLLVAIASIFERYYGAPGSAPLVVSAVSALVMGIGLLIVLFYYRRGKGTQLWLPRRVVERVSQRAKQTTHTVGAFGLGALGVLLELPFLLAPLVLAGLVLSSLPGTEKSIGLGAYTFAASIPLFVVTALVGGGHKISSIQRWRETNKKFLQWTSGVTLILLGVYLFATHVWGRTGI